MTVKELIDKLQTLELNNEICINSEIGYINISNVVKYPEKYLNDIYKPFYYLET